MSRFALATGASLLAGLQLIHAQTPSVRQSRVTPAQTPIQLPVRRVVLYKNGVGYFERIGRIRGNQQVGIDFTSAQLDDVLKSLTTLDLGNGRVTAVSYNSDTPLAQRLGTLRLPLGERTTGLELLDALRGARLEVRSGNQVMTGRLLGVERLVRDENRPNAAAHDEITLVTDNGS